MAYTTCPEKQYPCCFLRARGLLRGKGGALGRPVGLDQRKETQKENPYSRNAARTQEQASEAGLVWRDRSTARDPAGLDLEGDGLRRLVPNN